MCYTCVRECPAKAIRIAEGQAEVIAERCIACGNCVRVCSQVAKQVRGTIDEVEALLGVRRPVAACLAPSFPAEFTGTDYHAAGRHAPGVGFRHRAGSRLRRGPGRPAIPRAACADATATATSPRPARPSSATSNAIIRSWSARWPRSSRRWSPRPGRCGACTATDLKIVFIGPCIAKKVEAGSEEVARRHRRRADVPRTAPDVREPRHRRLDASSRASSIRRTARPARCIPSAAAFCRPPDLQEDLMTGEIVATQGRTHMHRGHQGIRRRRPGRAAAGNPLLRRLHHGRGHQQRPAAVQPPPARAQVRLPADGNARRRSSGWTTCRGSPTSTSAAASTPTTSGFPCPTRTNLATIMQRMGKFTRRRRTELRRLRLRHLPRARHRDLQGAGRERDVPAVHASTNCASAVKELEDSHASSWPTPRKP